jgi:type II secretory pathway pseudopilin PulG
MKKAFTLIEIIFILVIIGIIAATILTRTSTNPLQEAVTQVLSHIRYTQHLALVDDKFDATDTSWYKKRWLMVFSKSVGANNDVAYTIFSDKSTTGDPGIAGSEIALNPQDTSKKLTGGYGSTILPTDARVTRKLNLTKSYGVTNVSFSGGCPANGLRINFDHQGRPIKGKLGGASGSGNASAYENDNLIKTDCNITITNGTDNAIITISPETGYARITQYK